MNPETRNNTWVIVVTFLVAMLLDILPLPGALQTYWPEWLILVLLYWVVALPQRVGVGTAWVTGLFVDALQGSLLGSHALSLSLVAYFSLLLYQRIRLFPRWKQSFVVSVLVGIYLLTNFWLRSIDTTVERYFSYWIPMLTSALLWPWLFVLLRDLRRQFRVN